jgi:hypothetical protein
MRTLLPANTNTPYGKKDRQLCMPNPSGPAQVPAKLLISLIKFAFNQQISKKIT